MTEEYAFVLNKVNSQSLCDIGTKQAELQERRVIELYESAYEIIKMLEELSLDIGIFEILTLLSESLDVPLSEVHSDVQESNVFGIQTFLKSVRGIDKAIFADVLLKIFEKRCKSVNESDFLPTEKSRETFTYYKNPLADEAYDIFCEEFSDPRLTYASNLKEAVESVASNTVSYALLPLEEAGGERLHTASELIFRHDLKINSVTPVFGLDGSADMKYALVSRSFSIPEVRADDDLYLEIRLLTESVSLPELLCAAEYFGSSVYRINTQNFNIDRNDESFYTIVFKSKTGNFCGLLGYLTLFINSCTPVGIYKNLE